LPTAPQRHEASRWNGPVKDAPFESLQFRSGAAHRPGNAYQARFDAEVAGGTGSGKAVAELPQSVRLGAALLFVDREVNVFAEATFNVSEQPFWKRYNGIKRIDKSK